MKLSDAIDLYLGEQIRTTRTTYNYHLSHMVAFVGPARPIEAIDQADMLKYAQAVRASDLAESTAQQRLKTVKTFFNWLVRVEIITTSPAKGIKLSRPRRAVDRDKAMSDAEYEQIRGYFRERSRDYALMQRNLALFLFLGDTGCRAGAASRLTLDGLDLETMRASVIEKGSKSALVFFGEATRDEIRRWLIRRPAEAGPYVFSQGQRPLNIRSLSQIIRRACQRLELPTRSAHSIRHRKGHQLADAGVPVSVAATVLNHESIQTTLYSYYPADLQRAQDAVRKLAAQQPTAPENKITFPTRKKTV